MVNRTNGKVIWLYGRPCSGKTTLASAISESLKAKGVSLITLDGDELRLGVNADLGFSQTARLENIRRASEIAKLLATKGFWVICSFITPTIELRELVSKINLESDLVLIYIHASFESCQRRDVKGQYSRANKGLIANFTGVNSTFEEPVGDFNRIDTDELNIEEACKKCLEFILKNWGQPVI